MENLFTSREIAIAIIYLSIFLLFIYEKNRRLILKKLIYTCCNMTMLTPLILMLIYGVLLLFILGKFSLNRFLMVKDVSTWFLLVGIPACYSARNIKYDTKYTKRLISNNIKLNIVLDFFLNTFTFSLPFELFIQTIIPIFYLMKLYSDKNKDYRQVNSFLTYIINLFSVFIVFSTTINAINTFDNYELSSLIISFLTPIILYILYIPLIYIISVLYKYKEVYLRVKFKDKAFKDITFIQKIKIFMICKLSLKRIFLFDKYALQLMYMRYDSPSFNEVLVIFKKKLKNNDFDT